MGTGVDPKALGASLRRLERREGAALLQESLRTLVDASKGLFGLGGSGLMLADEHGELRYTVATDPDSQWLEDAQLACGEGPCVEAYVAEELVATADLDAESRWSELRARLAGKPIRAVLGVPVHLASVAVGSLDVYHTGPHQWHHTEQRALARFAEVAGVMLATTVQAESAGVLADQLSHAIRSRAPIERGVGYLMSRDRIGRVEAFELLRHEARSSRRSMGDVASDLLRSDRLPSEIP